MPQLTQYQKDYVLQNRGLDSSQYDIDDDLNIIEKTQPSYQPSITPATHDAPKFPTTRPPENNWFESFGKAAGESALPNLAGGAGAGLGYAIGGALAPETGGLSALAIPLISSLISGMGASYGARKLQEQVEPEDWQKNAALATQEHPIASKLGQLSTIPLSGFMPNPMNVLKAAGTAGKVGIAELAGDELSNVASQAELSNLVNVGAGAGISTGIDAAQQLMSHEPFSLSRLGESALTGATFNKPWALGKFYGFHDSAPSDIHTQIGRDALTTRPPNIRTTPETEPYNAFSYGAANPETRPDIVSGALRTAPERSDKMAKYKSDVTVTPDELSRVADEGNPIQGLQEMQAELQAEKAATLKLQHEVLLKNEEQQQTALKTTLAEQEKLARIAEQNKMSQEADAELNPKDYSTEVQQPQQKQISSMTSEEFLLWSKEKRQAALSEMDKRVEEINPDWSKYWDLNSQSWDDRVTKAIERHKKAIQIDPNAPLVEWHNKGGETKWIIKDTPSSDWKELSQQEALKQYNVTDSNGEILVLSKGSKAKEQSGAARTQQQKAMSEDASLPLNPTEGWFGKLTEFLKSKGLDVTQDNKLVSSTTQKPIAGRAKPFENLIELNPSEMGADTHIHELYHMFVNALRNSKRAGDRKIVEKYDNVVKDSPDYKTWSKQRTEEKLAATPEEYQASNAGYEFIKTHLNTRGESPLKKWVNDFGSYLKTRFSKHADVEDFQRLLDYRMTHENRSISSYGAGAKGTTQEHQSESSDLTPSRESSVGIMLQALKDGTDNASIDEGDANVMLSNLRHSVNFDDMPKIKAELSRKELDVLDPPTWARIEDMYNQYLNAPRIIPEKIKPENTQKIEPVKSLVEVKPPEQTVKAEITDVQQQPKPQKKIVSTSKGDAGIFGRPKEQIKPYEPTQLESYSPELLAKEADANKQSNLGWEEIDNTKTPKTVAKRLRESYGNINKLIQERRAEGFKVTSVEMQYLTKQLHRVKLQYEVLINKRGISEPPIDATDVTEYQSESSDLRNREELLNDAKVAISDYWHLQDKGHEGYVKYWKNHSPDVFEDYKKQGFSDTSAANEISDNWLQTAAFNAKMPVEEFFKEANKRITEHQSEESDLKRIKESPNEGERQSHPFKLSEYEKYHEITDKLGDEAMDHVHGVNIKNEGSGATNEDIDNAQHAYDKFDIMGKAEYGEHNELNSSPSFLPKFIRAEVDKIGEIDHPDASAVKTAITKFYEHRRKYIGSLTNDFLDKILPFIPRTSLKSMFTQNTPEFDNVVQRRWDMNDYGHSTITLTPKEQRIDDLLKLNLQKSVDLKNSFPAFTPTTPDPNYLPMIPSRKTLDTLLNFKNPTERAQLLRDWHDYYTGTLGKTQAESDSALKLFMAGYRKQGSNLAEQFGPIDKSAGLGLPRSWRENNLVDIMSRFNNRYGRRLAYHAAIETDPVAMHALNDTETGMAASDVVKNVTDDISGVRESNEALRSAASGLIRAAMLGPLTGAKDFVSNLTLGLQHQTLPQAIMSPLESMSEIGKNIRESFKAGVNRHNISALESGDEFADMANVLRRTRDVISVVQGRNFLEKVTRGVAYGQGKYLAMSNLWSIHNGSGSKTAVKFMNDFAPENWRSHIATGSLPPEALMETAAKYVESVQGTYDYRGLPSLAQKGTLAPYASLARWNIEKLNNFDKHILQPARAGNIVPLLMSTIGMVIGGETVNQLVQSVTGRKEKTPNLKELSAIADEPDSKLAPAVLYKLAGLASLSGFAGLAGDLSKVAMDKWFHNNVQSYNNPLIAGATSMGQNVSDMIQAFRNGDFNVGTDVLSQTMEDLFQSYRLVHKFVDPDKQKEIEKNNKYRDLKLFKSTTGMPVSDVTEERANPFTDKDLRKFKQSNDVSESVELLPKLIQHAFEKADGNIETLQSELRKIKANSYQTMPSPDNMPLSFLRFLNRLRDTQGEEAASERLVDYMKQNELNKGKSEMVPSL